MKRHGNLFELCFTEENLFHAYLEARRGKRNKRACFEFEKTLSSNLSLLHSELHSNVYSPRPYYKFHIQDPKPRIIFAPAFRDVVVQHAIYQQIYPIFDRTFIETSFACRKGKGTHRCADYVQDSMRKSPPDSFNAHLDVRKFFYMIDRGILRELLERKIKEPHLIDLLMKFANHGEPLGIPIGNLLSQLFALIYLNPVDHFIKRELKVKFYTRYVDDMALIGLSLDDAQEFSEKIENFLDDQLNLSLSKSKIFQMRKGLNFVGFRTWRSKRFVRRHSLFQFGKALRKENIISINSLMAHAKNTATNFHFCKRIILEKPHLIPNLPHFIQQPKRTFSNHE